MFIVYLLLFARHCAKYSTCISSVFITTLGNMQSFYLHLTKKTSEIRFTAVKLFGWGHKLISDSAQICTQTVWLQNHTSKALWFLARLLTLEWFTSEHVICFASGCHCLETNISNNWMSTELKLSLCCFDFIAQVCIAKCNSISSLDSVLSQDLIVIEGPAVEVGDSLEVAYTSWLFQNHGLGQVRKCILQVLL